MNTKKKIDWEKDLPSPIANYFWFRMMLGNIYRIQRLEGLVINHVAINGGNEAELLMNARKIAERELGLDPRN